VYTFILFPRMYPRVCLCTRVILIIALFSLTSCVSCWIEDVIHNKLSQIHYLHSSLWTADLNVKAKCLHFCFYWTSYVLRYQLCGSYVYLTNVNKKQPAGASLCNKARTCLAVKWNRQADRTTQYPTFVYRSVGNFILM